MSSNLFFSPLAYDRLSIDQTSQHLDMIWNSSVVPAYKAVTQALKSKSTTLTLIELIDNYKESMDKFLLEISQAKVALWKRGAKTGGEYHTFITEYLAQTKDSYEVDLQTFKDKTTDSEVIQYLNDLLGISDTGLIVI